MSAADALITTLLRMVGRTPEDLATYVKAGENRLRELRAFTRGGTIEGVAVPGMAALYAETQALNRRVASLLAAIDVAPVLGSPNPSPKSAAESPATVAESVAEVGGGIPHPQQE